jgi:hypothetical protein
MESDECIALSDRRRVSAWGVNMEFVVGSVVDAGDREWWTDIFGGPLREAPVAFAAQSA